LSKSFYKNSIFYKKYLGSVFIKRKQKEDNFVSLIFLIIKISFSILAIISLIKLGYSSKVRFTRLREIDAYGNEDYKKWIGNPPLDEKAIENNIFNGSKRFKEGIPYFWEKVILKIFGSIELFFEKWKSYCIENPTIDDEIVGSIRKLETEDWFVFIASQIEKSCLNLIEKNYSNKNKENYKKGIRFENHCMEILKQNGWEVKETPNTGDQGVDLIASINDLRICIQCKDHEKAIGNKAVQEISAGKLFWKGTHAIIVSKSGFTKSAHQLAKSNKVKLINEYQLKDLEKFIV